MKKVLFLADAHIGSSRDAADELCGYIRERLVDAAGLYLLGDVFHYAVGLPNFRTDAIERVVGFLGDLARKGLSVGYVAGNRDYFAPQMFARYPEIVVTEDGLDIDPFGVPVHLAHGDTVNPEDRQYLRWRRVSHSRPVRLLARALPAALARRLGDRVERELRATNQAMRIRFPEEHVAAFGAAAFARGRRLVLLGHFHLERTMSIGCDAALHVVPDWLSRRTHAELHEDGRFVLDASVAA